MIIRDKEGQEFVLTDGVIAHITRFHPEITVYMIEKVILDPDIIVKSSWDEKAVIRYKKTGKYYKAVVLDVVDRRIKTALTTDKVKQGEILWKK